MKHTPVIALVLGSLLALGCAPSDKPADATKTDDTHSTATDQPADATPADAMPADGTDTASATDTAAAADAGATDPAAMADATGAADPAAAVAASPVWTADEDKMAKTTPTGLKILITKPGKDAATTATSNVTVNYSGWLLDGTAFDSNVDPKFGHVEPFKLNAPWGVIPGWVEGLVGMQKGETRKLYIPAALAYGPQSPSPLIPANSPLIFEVEMVDFS